MPEQTKRRIPLSLCSGRLHSVGAFYGAHTCKIGDIQRLQTRLRQQRNQCGIFRRNTKRTGKLFPRFLTGRRKTGKRTFSRKKIFGIYAFRRLLHYRNGYSRFRASGEHVRKTGAAIQFRLHQQNLRPFVFVSALLFQSLFKRRRSG